MTLKEKTKYFWWQIFLQSTLLYISLLLCRIPQGQFIYAYLGNLDAPDRANPPSPASSSSNIGQPTITDALSSSPNVMKSPGASASSHAEMSPPELVLLSSDSEDENPVQPLSVRVREKGGRVPAGQVRGEGAVSSSGCGGTVKQTSGRKRACVERDRFESDNGKEGLGHAGVECLAALKTTKKAQPFCHRTSSEGESECVMLDISSDSESKIEGGTGGGNSVEATTNQRQTDLGHPEFELAPGSFEVILIVDSSESSASRK